MVAGEGRLPPAGFVPISTGVPALHEGSRGKQAGRAAAGPAGTVPMAFKPGAEGPFLHGAGAKKRWDQPPVEGAAVKRKRGSITEAVRIIGSGLAAQPRGT